MLFLFRRLAHSPPHRVLHLGASLAYKLFFSTDRLAMTAAVG